MFLQIDQKKKKRSEKMPDDENCIEDLLKESIKSALSWFSQVPRLLSSGTSYIDSRGNSSQHFDFFFFLRLNGKLLYLRTSGSRMIKLAGLSSPYHNFSPVTRSRISLLSNYSLRRECSRTLSDEVHRD